MDSSWYGSVKIEIPDGIFGAICLDSGRHPKMAGLFIEITPQLSGWWLNQPLWKICSSNWEVFPNFRGENKTYLKPPPSCWILSHLLLFYNFSERTRQLIIHIHRESVMNPPDTRSIQTTTNLLFKCLLNFLAKHVLVPLSDSNHFCWTQQNPIKPKVKPNRRQGSRYSWKVESQHLRDIAQFLSVCFWAREKEHGS